MKSGSISASLLLGVVDHSRYAIELGARQLGSSQLQQCRDCLFSRVVEERLEHMGERRPPRCVAPNCWTIDVRPPVFLMQHSTLLLECAQRCTHRGIAGRVRNPVHHFTDGCLSLLKEKIHDLPLSAAETFEF